MQRVPENELLNVCYARLNTLAPKLGSQFDDEELEKIRVLIAQVLVDENKINSAAVTLEKEEVDASSSFKSILYRNDKDEPTQIVVFNIKSVLVEIALPIIGIAISVFTGKFALTAIPQIAGVVKTFWKKLVILKIPGDEEAIDVIQSLLKARTKLIIEENILPPTTSQIRESSALDSVAFKRGLSRLKELEVIEIVKWAGQKGDIDNPANQWKIAL